MLSRNVKLEWAEFIFGQTHGGSGLLCIQEPGRDSPDSAGRRVIVNDRKHPTGLLLQRSMAERQLRAPPPGMRSCAVLDGERYFATLSMTNPGGGAIAMAKKQAKAEKVDEVVQHIPEPWAKFSQAGKDPVRIRDIKVILTAPDGIRLVIVKVETTEPGLSGIG